MVRERERQLSQIPQIYVVPPGSREFTLQVTAGARLMSKCFKKYGYFRRAESHCNSVCGAGSSDADKEREVHLAAGPEQGVIPVCQQYGHSATSVYTRAWVCRP